MVRRKYRFADRAEAELNYDKARRGQLLAEWLLSAILDGRNVEIGGNGEYTVGYVVLQHTSFVYAIRAKQASPCVHRISGIWDAGCETLSAIIRQMNRYDDGVTFAALLSRARGQAEGGAECTS